MHSGNLCGRLHILAVSFFTVVDLASMTEQRYDQGDDNNNDDDDDDDDNITKCMTKLALTQACDGRSRRCRAELQFKSIPAPIAAPLLGMCTPGTGEPPPPRSPLPKPLDPRIAQAPSPLSCINLPRRRVRPPPPLLDFDFCCTA